MPGDTAAFQKALANRGEAFEGIAARAKSSGAIHHRFGIGEGFVLVVDECRPGSSGPRPAAPA